jgi:hypothetical protein
VVEIVNSNPLWPHVTSDWLRAVLHARQLRHDLLGKGLFHDPPWDILLLCFANYLERRTTSVSDLCRASKTPESTTLRWLRALEKQQLITTPINTHGQDVENEIELRPEAVLALQKYFGAISSHVVPL